MKLILDRLTNLRALYIQQLRSLLSAEDQIVRALPRMVEKASEARLKQAFSTHLHESEEHLTRLTGILNHTVGKADPIKSKVLSALIEEAEQMIDEAVDDSVRDAALIAAAQRVEHYEIAAYGALRSFAYVLGAEGDAEILNQTLQEEGHADHLLSEISQDINPIAQRAA